MVGQSGMMLTDVLTSLGQVAETLTLVGNALGTEENQLFVSRQIVVTPSLKLVHRGENAGIDGIGDVGDGVALRQCTLACQIGHPAAATHKSDVPALIHGPLAVKNPPCQVPLTLQHRATLAPSPILLTHARIVADASEIPLVVQGHHHRLATGKDAFQVIERQESLVDPMQMDDIGLLELVHRGDVGARIGDIHLKYSLLAQVVGQPDDATLPQEVGLEFP